MKKKQKLTEIEVNERIKKVNGAMVQEGMPLTKEEKQVLRNCINGKSTHEKERQKILDYCKEIYG